MKYLVLIILAALILFYAHELYDMRKRIVIGEALAAEAVPFERILDNPEMRILVIGDSTAVGTGAEKPEFSIAGRISADFPNASVKNLGVNGMKVHELVEKLEEIQDQRFDFISLHIGGNDIVRFTNLQQLEKDIDRAFKLTSELTDNISITVTGNMGTSTLFPYGTGWVLERQTRKVHALFIAAAEKYGAVYNNLFRERGDDPFAKNPGKYYAADEFHPSGEGYADWYEIIQPNIMKLLKNKNRA